MIETIGVGLAMGAIFASISSSFGTVEIELTKTRRALSELTKESHALGKAKGGKQDTALSKSQRKEKKYTYQAEIAKLSTLQDEAKLRSSLVMPMLKTTAGLAAMTLPIKAAAEYADSLNALNMEAKFAPDQLKAFGHELLTLSSRIPLSSDAFTHMAVTASQAGVAQSELLGFVEDSALMATAFRIDPTAAVAAMDTMRDSFNLSQDSMRLLGDSIAHVAQQNFGASAAELTSFVSSISGTAATFGMTGQEIVAMGAAFSAVNVEMQDGATAAKALFTGLGQASSLSGDAQQALASLGYSAQNMAQAMKNDAQGTITEFLQRVSTSKKPHAALSSLFGPNAAPDIVKMAAALTAYDTALKSVGDQSLYAGAQQQAFNTASHSAKAQMLMTSNAMAKVSTAFGTALLPAVTSILGVVTPVISAFGDMISQNEGLIQSVAGVTAAFMAGKVFKLGIAYISSGLRSFGSDIHGTGTFVRGVLGSVRNGTRTALEAISRFGSASAAAFRQSAGGAFMAKSGMLANTKATLGLVGASTKATVAQRLLNLAFMANPIGLLVTGVAALVSWFYSAYEVVGSLSGALSLMWNQTKALASDFIQFFSGLGESLNSYLPIDALSTGVSPYLYPGINPIKIPPPSDEAKQRAHTAESPATATPTRTAVAPSMTNINTSSMQRVNKLNIKAEAVPSHTNKSPLSGLAQSTQSQGGGHSGTASPSAPTSRPGATGTSGGSGPSVSMNFHISGITDNGFTQRLMEALRNNSGQFERIIADIVHTQERLAHG